MAATVDTELIEHIARTIVERFRPKRIVLIGSRARGDHRPDSDIDLFVEMESTLRPHERAVNIGSAFSLHPWAMDVLVYTPEEIARLRGRIGGLLTAVEREGKVLYERP